MGGVAGRPGDVTYIGLSYRYLRIANVVVIFMLGVSLVLELLSGACMQGSISAYYYTAVHSIFVGALFTLGVTMIAMRSKDVLEDLFLNLAGVLAPVVALVPTAPPMSDVCGIAGQDVDVSTGLLVSNNVIAMFAGALLAIVVASAIARRTQRSLGSPRRSATAGVVFALVLLGGGWAWYTFGRESFDERAHGAAAVSMFVAIWLAVVVNARIVPPRLFDRVYDVLGESPAALTPEHRRALPWYRAIVAFMPVAAVAVLLPNLFGRWRQTVFFLEVFEIAPFAAFWLIQTIERWHEDAVAVATAT